MCTEPARPTERNVLDRSGLPNQRLPIMYALQPSPQRTYRYFRAVFDWMWRVLVASGLESGNKIHTYRHDSFTEREGTGAYNL
jgi:hypothetical protein